MAANALRPHEARDVGSCSLVVFPLRWTSIFVEPRAEPLEAALDGTAKHQQIYESFELRKLSRA